MTEPLPPYTIAVYKHKNYELIAVKRLSGYWDIVGTDEYWFDSDEQLFEEWPELMIVGEGIWPHENRTSG